MLPGFRSRCTTPLRCALSSASAICIPYFEHLLERQCAFLQSLRQRLAFHAFHHQIIDTILTPHVVQHTNVRMIQAGDGFRFALEALLANGIAGKMCWENFDGNGALQPRVPRTIHLAHPARANRVQDLIGSQPNSVGQWHLDVILHRKKLGIPERPIRDSLRGPAEFNLPSRVVDGQTLPYHRLGKVCRLYTQCAVAGSNGKMMIANHRAASIIYSVLEDEACCAT